VSSGLEEGLRTLAEASRTIAAQKSAEDVYDCAAYVSARLLHAQQAALYLNDLSAAWSLHRAYGPEAANCIGRLLVDVPGGGVESTACRLFDEPAGPGERHRLIRVPLKSGRGMLGAIVLRRPAPAAPFSAQDCFLLETLALHIASRVEALSRMQSTPGSLPTENIREMMTGAAHEAHAGLHHIQASVQALKQSLAASQDATVARELARIAGAADSLLRLSKALFEFVRLQILEPTPVPVDCEPLLADLIEEIRRSTPRADVQWQIGHIDAVQCNPVLLRAALAELLRNAIKFTRKHAAARIEVGSAESTADTVVLYVRDDGVGFDPAYGHKLFEAFQRLHSARDYEGFGLGLACVKAVVTRLGGSVRAEGSSGKGMTVYLTLPRAQDPGGDDR
jgi:signal transduction histidine kinase